MALTLTFPLPQPSLIKTRKANSISVSPNGILHGHTVGIYVPGSFPSPLGSTLDSPWHIKNAPFRMMDMPVELVLTMAAFLPDNDAASFALSCKLLYSIIKIPRLRGSEKQKFLFSLQRDVPNLYFCESCIRLHSYPAEIGPSRPDLFPNSGSRCYHDGEMHSYNQYYNLKFYHIQLAMDRHFYGPSHGIPLENLHLNYTHCFPSGLCVDLSWTPKVINDQMHIAASYQFYHKSKSRNIYSDLATQLFEICAHLRTDSATTRRNYVTTLPELMGYDFFGQSLHGMNSEMPKDGPVTMRNACDHCLTDYEITIQKVGRDGWKWIRLNVWHQLGAGRTPQDPCWQSFIKPAAVVIPVHHRPGTIRQAFEQ